MKFSASSKIIWGVPSLQPTSSRLVGIGERAFFAVVSQLRNSLTGEYCRPSPNVGYLKDKRFLGRLLNFQVNVFRVQCYGIFMKLCNFIDLCIFLKCDFCKTLWL